jgi:hypothetical protein
LAIIKAVKGKNISKGCLKNVIKYVTHKEKTEEKLISGHNCLPETVLEEMKSTKMIWNKEDGRQFKHYVQSFNPEDKIDLKKAHEITQKFVEQSELFKKYEVLIATHKDTKHVHSHIVVNSVSFEDGKKFKQSFKDLQEMKDRSNELSRTHGLTPPKEKTKDITTYDLNKYKALEKDIKEIGKYKSYVVSTAVDVNQVLKSATSKEEFIKRMESKGYQVTWKDTRKNVTFQNQDGKKVRSSNLEGTFKQEKFSKEGMENEFRRNQQQRGQERRYRLKEGGRLFSDKQQNGRDRISKFPANGVVGAIQSAVREIKDTIKRATETTEERHSRIQQDRKRAEEFEQGFERVRERER